MQDYDKKAIREELSIDDYFQLVTEWGGNPEFTPFGFISDTICHNPPGEGSRKLYFYENSDLFKCYTDCDCAFDIFELTIKVAQIQSNRKMDLNDAVRYLAAKFNIVIDLDDTEDLGLTDWQYLIVYDKINDIPTVNQVPQLKEYDKRILGPLAINPNYLTPWINDHIKPQILAHAQIGYNFSTDQISIPHFDKDGRFIGLRGRTVVKEDAERFGKYRPMIINKQQYNHSLGLNLYNLNNSKDNIKRMGKAIVFESEKSTLQFQSYFGLENDISVACCGSSVSSYQIQLLIEDRVQEIIIAFDRQFQELGDNEFKRLKTKLLGLHKKYKNEVLISFIFDKHLITSYKASPTDEGPEKFMQLFKERIIL